jgi:hypothetical protein
MSLFMLRAAILAQGGDTAAPPIDLGSAWELDATRRPAGYILTDGNQTAINTSGGSDYRRWVPSVRAIRPFDGRRYWEVLCATGGAAMFDGYIGVVSAAQLEEYDAGINPITLGSIGWRGNGTLWSSDTGLAAQRLSGLPTHGAGDVLMFVLDPANARLWIGLNGIWQNDPLTDPPTWTAGGSAGFHPQIQGRNPGDGATLRALASQFSYPVPPGLLALGHDDPDLRIHQAHAFIEFGGGRGLTSSGASLFLDLGGADHLTAAYAALYIEVELP